MNLNHLINLVTNQVIRRVINIAVDHGFRFVSRKAAKAPMPVTDQAVRQTVPTPAELANEAQLQALADQAAKTATMTGRIGR